jgi:hypothetical protein
VAKLPLILLSLGALVSLAFAVRYFFTKQFMAYHAVVMGKSWAELERGVQTSILGMLRICAGGFATYGLAVLWLLLPLSRGETWAAWAVLTLSATTLLPVLYVTIMLRRFEPRAKTPIGAPAIVLLLVLAGVGTALFG